MQFVYYFFLANFLTAKWCARTNRLIAMNTYRTMTSIQTMIRHWLSLRSRTKSIGHVHEMMRFALEAKMCPFGSFPRGEGKGRGGWKQKELGRYYFGGIL